MGPEKQAKTTDAKTDIVISSKGELFNRKEKALEQMPEIKPEGRNGIFHNFKPESGILQTEMRTQRNFIEEEPIHETSCPSQSFFQ